MADKKIIDLTAIVTQVDADLYETSANGMGSFKETRLQQKEYWNANLFSSQYVVYVAKNGNNSTGNGKQLNPYADPFAAMAAISGQTQPQPYVINITSPGTYSTTDVELKPNVDIYANNRSTIIGATNQFILNGSGWATIVSPAECKYNNFTFSGSIALDFGIASPGIPCTMTFNNCWFSTGGFIQGNSGQVPTGIFYNCKIQEFTFQASNAIIIGGSTDGDIDILTDSIGESVGTSRISGHKIGGNLYLAGFSGAPLECYLECTPTQTIQIDNIYVTLYIDPISTPANGFTFLNGAEPVQVQPLSNAAAKIGDNYFIGNNSYTGQNVTVPESLSSSSGIVNWDLNIAPNALLTLTENTTIAAPTNQKSGADYCITITQNGSSPQTLAWNSVFKFQHNVVPTMSSTLGAIDMYFFKSNGTNMLESGISQSIGS